MTIPHRWLAALGLAAAVATTGCLCDAEEQYAVTVSAPDSLVVVRDGATRKIEVVTRVSEREFGESAFQFVYDAIEGSTSGEGVALTLSGIDPASNEAVVLVLALPVSLRRGDAYPVGATFAVEAGVPSDPRLFGPRDLQQPTQAEAAFTIATYTFPPGRYDATFRAVTSSGTIRITNRQRGWVEMALDLRLVDATGKTVTVTGRAQANSESSTPPCT